MKTLWMKVDLKNEEQPLAVADTIYQLANMCQVSVRSIQQHICRQRRLGEKCCYRKVEVEDE